MSSDQNQQTSMPVKKAIGITIVVIVAIVIVVVLTMLLKVPMWIPFLGLCVWVALGMSFELKKIISIWVSAAIALVTGYLFGHTEELGMGVLVIALVLIIILIYCMISGTLTFLFNIATGIFLAAGTAEGLVIDIVPGLKGLLFGFVLFGLLPWFAVSAMQKKKNKEE